MGAALTVGLDGDRGVIRFATGDAEVFSKNAMAYPLPDDEELLYLAGTAEVFYPDNAEVPRKLVLQAARSSWSPVARGPASMEC
ncbi:Imm1 family immunity protein [Amycolatopsis sp. NPDC001319]|uniref:Imm1 family immunity protein n=1 Tax=unclassified Amycolatopsis TaxID=2618356 RepID=UPI0036787457